MNANELRIGNQIYVNSQIVSLTASDIQSIDQCLRFGIELNYCNPIKITEEMLFKMGFKFEYEKMADRIYSFGSFRIYWNKSEGYCFYHTETKLGKNFSYLHQLQNLFFDLTGDILSL